MGGELKKPTVPRGVNLVAALPMTAKDRQEGAPVPVPGSVTDQALRACGMLRDRGVAAARRSTG
jgi:hypothetical protein